MRIIAFLAALGAFVFQIYLAGQAGVSPLTVVLGTFASIAVLAAVLVAVFVAVARRNRRRRLTALIAQRPGWDAAGFLSALPAGTPAGTPVPAPRTGVLLFNSEGVELVGGDGKRLPYEHLVTAPWLKTHVEAARVQYVAGRAVTKAGVTFQVTGQPTRQFTLMPERSLRGRFPGLNATECVLAAMHSRRPVVDDIIGT